MNAVTWAAADKAVVPTQDTTQHIQPETGLHA
jgi:hypothetical protein